MTKKIIGIIGAMKEEIEPLLKYYNTYETISHAGNEFYKVELEDKKLIIVKSKIGKVYAAITTTSLIEKFKVEKVLFSGVAGGINSDFKVGDLMMAEKLCQHDFDITTFGHPHGHIPGAEVFINADKKLLNLAANIAKEKGINLKSGVIATGDQFIANNSKKEWIKTTFLADAIEMEGAAVAQVCSTYLVDFFILRAISDSADSKAEVTFEEFLKISAKVSADFVISMIEKL